MAFKLTIETGNDAFYPEPRDEIFRILQKLSARVIAGDPMTGTILDVNGNDVGYYEFLPADDEQAATVDD